MPRLRVAVVAARAMERSAFMAVLDRAGVDLSSLDDFVNCPTVWLIREGAGVRTRPVLRDMAKRDRDHVRVLALCDSMDEIVEAVAAGAHGALLAHCSPSRLIRALHAVIGGDSVVPAGALEQALHGNGRITLDPLESEVLACLAGGNSDSEIAKRCSLSYTAVRTIIGSLLRTFGATTRLEVVVRAHLLGLPTGVRGAPALPTSSLRSR